MIPDDAVMISQNVIQFGTDGGKPPAEGSQKAADHPISYQLICKAAHQRCRCFLRCPEAPVGSIASLWPASLTPTGNAHLNPKSQVPIAAIVLYSAS
jgi:hypothetical protein